MPTKMRCDSVRLNQARKYQYGVQRLIELRLKDVKLEIEAYLPCMREHRKMGNMNLTKEQLRSEIDRFRKRVRALGGVIRVTTVVE